MKKLAIFTLLVFTVLVGCKDKEVVNPLIKTWTVNTGNGDYVTVDGEDISYQYAGFEIQFQEVGSKVFFVTNGGTAFPLDVDTWEYNADKSAIIRGSDGVEISQVIEGGSLTLRFSIDIYTNARTEGTFGNFEFKLSPK